MPPLPARPALPPIPPLADGFIPRPETGQDAAIALVPGATVVLVSDRGAGARLLPPATSERVASGAREWADSCGKTQLAISVARGLRRAGQVEIVIWACATSRASILSTYREAAAALGLQASGDAEAVASGLLGWLRASGRPWLVVLDDLRAAAAMDRLWPAGPAGRVLVTTTSVVALPDDPASPVLLPIGPLSHRESLAYLMGRLTDDLDQRQGAADLVSELGDEPLALVQASSVIMTSEHTCRGYLARLTDRRERFAGHGASPAALTWTVSVEHADELAAAIAHAQLTFASLLDGNGMPYSVFLAAGRQAAIPDSTMHDGMAALEASGLLTIDRSLDPPMVRTNWVVQAATRAAIPQASVGPMADAAASALLAQWPGEGQPEWLARAFRSCADSLRWSAADALWQGGCHKLLLHAGRSLDALPAPSAAVGYWSELAATSDRMLGADHPDTLTISEYLARAYLAAGRPGDAIAWFQWVRNDRSSRLGPSSAATADASRDLGRALLAAGRVTEANNVLSDAAAAYEHVLGGDSLEAMSVRDDLIAGLRATGELPGAIAVGQRVLADRERVQGSRHPETLASATRLGEAYVADGQTKPAISLLKRAVSDSEKVLGPRHEDTIAARAVLAGAYHEAGKMASAVQLYEQVREQYAQSHGVSHRLTLTAGLNLAHAQFAVGRRTDGTQLLQETTERCEMHLPPGDPLTATARDSLRNAIGGGTVTSAPIPIGIMGGGSPLDAASTRDAAAVASGDVPGGVAPADGPDGPPLTEEEARLGFRRISGRHRTGNR